MVRKTNIYKMCEEDTIDQVVEKNEKLISRVRNLEKENRKLKSENKSLTNAWNNTELKWKKEIKEISLEDIFESIEHGTPLKNLRRSCKECDSKKMKKLEFDKFEIIICGQCGYRTKIDK